MLFEPAELFAVIPQQVVPILGAHLRAMVAIGAQHARRDRAPQRLGQLIGLTGEQLARELTAIEPRVPIIMCSGFSEQIGWEAFQAIGVKALLTKPITLAEMAQKVRQVLDAVPSGSRQA